MGRGQVCGALKKQGPGLSRKRSAPSRTVDLLEQKAHGLPLRSQAEDSHIRCSPHQPFHTVFNFHVKENIGVAVLDQTHTAEGIILKITQISKYKENYEGEKKRGRKVHILILVGTHLFAYSSNS